MVAVFGQGMGKTSVKWDPYKLKRSHCLVTLSVRVEPPVYSIQMRWMNWGGRLNVFVGLKLYQYQLYLCECV